MEDTGQDHLGGGLPNAHVVVITNGDDLSAFSELTDTSHPLSVESAELDEGLGEELLLFGLLVLFLLLFFVDQLSLNFQLSEDTGLGAADQDLEGAAVVQEGDVVRNLRLSNGLSESPLLLDLFFQHLQGLVRFLLRVSGNDLWRLLNLEPLQDTLLERHDQVLLSDDQGTGARVGRYRGLLLADLRVNRYELGLVCADMDTVVLVPNAAG